MGLYEATKNVWRPMEEHNMLSMFVSQIGFAATIAFFVSCPKYTTDSCPGAKSGTFVGLRLD
ncbi:hypothetical protein DID80_07840 [Candidatus Marinamargulisbacteria bacterium SCGC AAA071-K20]|nr:hypothetical protein DID80_07840 [Candidatus Marinamargulisbacteria bacterium SCGC AAA071-K20]